VAEAEQETSLETIKQLNRAEPFMPFGNTMTSGDRYTMNDADALAVTPSQLHYYRRGGMGIHLRVNQIAAVEQFGEEPAA